MNGTEGLSIADAMALRGNGFNDGFGGDGAWWILILLFLFAGNGNWGNWGGNNGCCTPATAQGMTDAFNFSQLNGDLVGINTALNTGFAQTQLGMCQGFNGVQAAICDNGYNNQAGFSALSNQIGFLACDIEKGQDNIRYDIATQGNAIVKAVDDNADRIINYLTQAEMDRLRTELQSAQFQISQSEQTQNIVNQLLPVAKPAYITCSPYASAFGNGYNPNYYSGCGCGN